MKEKEIEAEGGELVIRSKEGHYAIIPAKDRAKVMKMIEDNCTDCVNEFIKGLPLDADYAEDGTLVSDLYKEKTGKDWKTAKEEGLTSGSYEDNMALRAKLLSGEITKNISPTEKTPELKSSPTSGQAEDYSTAKDFNEAFKIARKQLGANEIFEYQGRKYGTNLQGEEFNPSEETLAKQSLNTEDTKKRLETQNKLTKSVYSTKKTSKLEPEYQDWDKVKQRQGEINKMDQADIIKSYHKGSDKQYVIIDKKRGKAHLYKGDKEISSYNVGTGQNEGDAQTKTVVKNGKVDWAAGNKSTGAGIYTVSNANPSNDHYSGAPSWNFINEQGIEVGMAMHSSFGDRTAKIKDDNEENNRLSNGCINGVCTDLKELYESGFTKGDNMYVLPDDDENTYELSNGKLIFKSKSPDVNRTVNTLKHNPIKITLPKDDNPVDNEFAQALVSNKKELLSELKINGDVYNEIALLALGVMGQESGNGESLKYMAKEAGGDTYQDLGQKARKFFKNPTDSITNFITKGETIQDTENNSKGLTQIKYDSQNDEVKKLWAKHGVTRENLNTADKSAIATVILFAHMYNNELKDTDLLKESGVDWRDALLYLNQGKKSELKNKTATPEKNTYIRNVKQNASRYKLSEKV